jgi:serine/threonine-protein kinase
LEHPSIVRVFAWGSRPDGAQYLAMEYVEGKTLDALITERGAMDVEGVVAIATKLCDALTYAHGLGVVHRDIKPANIMLGADDAVKLLDFGLAKFVGSDLRVTRTEAIVGSPVYMAPEQFMSKEVGPRSDVYGLACTLYEALTARVAFGGETPFEIFNAHSCGEYEPLPETLPAHVRAALDKALQSDAERRFASAEAFKLALTGDVPVDVVPRVVAPGVRRKTKFRVSAKVYQVGVPVLIALGLLAAGTQWYMQYDSLQSRAARIEKSGDHPAAVTLYKQLYDTAVAEKGQASQMAQDAALGLARNQRAVGDLRGLKETWRTRIAWAYENEIHREKSRAADLLTRDREIRAAQSILPLIRLR